MLKTLKIAGSFAIIAFFTVVLPVKADYGYETTVDCDATEARSNATRQVYIDFTNATTDSISFTLIPSFDDNNCTVKKPSGYDQFKYLKVALTSNIQESSDNLTFTNVNATGNGEIAVTISGLQPATEYQFRFTGVFAKSSDGTLSTGTLDTDYYSTAVPPITNLAISGAGHVTWNDPAAASYNSTKITLSYINNVDGSEIAYSTQYPDGNATANSYDIYDFANYMYDGNYTLRVTASMAKFYNNIDQIIWGTPVDLVFRTSQGEVVLTGEAASLTTPVISKANKNKITWQAVTGATYYKLKISSKSGKKLLYFKDLTSISKKLSSTQQAKLKARNYIKLWACIDAGCSEAATKTFKK